MAIKNVTRNEPFFDGHFPGNPIMPGVLVIEAMAQTAGLLLLHEIEDRDRRVLFFPASRGPVSASRRSRRSTADGGGIAAPAHRPPPLPGSGPRSTGSSRWRPSARPRWWRPEGPRTAARPMTSRIHERRIVDRSAGPGRRRGRRRLCGDRVRRPDRRRHGDRLPRDGPRRHGSGTGQPGLSLCRDWIRPAGPQVRGRVEPARDRRSQPVPRVLDGPTGVPRSAAASPASATTTCS